MARALQKSKAWFTRLALTGMASLFLPPGVAADITLVLGEPEYGQCGAVSINGGVSSDAGDITKMDWYWGDGAQNQSWFAAEHEYSENGIYEVEVTAHDSTGDTKTTSAEVTIDDATEPGCELTIRVHPETVYLRDGKTSEQLRIEIRDADYRPVDPGNLQVELSSDDPVLVQVSPNGLVTSTGYGHAMVTLTLPDSGRQAFVDVYAGHLRTRPLLQYLSLDGHATGEVWVDMGNADGTPVDLAGHSVEYLCSGCDPGEPLQVDANGVVRAVDFYEEGDPTPLSVMAIVDGLWAQNLAFVHVSEFDYGLTVANYVTQNTMLASPLTVGDYDFDHVINTVRLPEMLEYGFHAEKELAGGVWGGGGKQAFTHYVSPPVVTGIPACGGSGNPIQLGSDLYDPLMTCFITESAPEEMTHGYGIPFHELGHNFTWTHSRFADFADGGDGFTFSEGLATAMGMFACESILRDSEALGLSPDVINIFEYSWLCWRSPRSGEWLADYVANGADYANFDPNIVDEIIWNLVQEHGWGILYRFYSSLLPREQGTFPFPIETAEQQATFFALAMSEAADTELKSRFRDDWGFPIDNGAWDLMQPLVNQLVAQRDPASFAGVDRIIKIDDLVTLSDAFVFDPEGDDVAIEWQIISQPPGAHAQLGDNTTLHTTFTADQLGSYTLGLSASDKWVRGEQDTVVVTVASGGDEPRINAGYSGAWYNHETAGQGQLIDIEPTNRFMFLSWFTYTPASSDHPFEQHWFTAQGNYIGNKAELVVYETLNGKFDDPQAVDINAVGTATLSFTDCGLGEMNYSVDTLALSGSFPLQRAIPGSDDLCQQQQAMTTQSVDINGGMDGVWFDQSTPGQGFMIDAHPNPDGGNFIFVAWFTYGDDTASGQRWLTAQGSFAGHTAAINVYETTDGSFDDSQAVNIEKIGTMTIDFQDCSNALLSYQLTDEVLQNSIAISRGIPAAQALCEELARAE